MIAFRMKEARGGPLGGIKSEAIKMIKSLPEECTWEDIHYHMYVREKVERGRRDIEAGRVVPLEEVKKKGRNWSKSAGQNPP